MQKNDFAPFWVFFGTTVWSIGSLSIPFDKTHRILFETRLEHVPRRSAAGITRIWCQLHFHRFLAFFGTQIGPIESLIIPLDRAHRVRVGTRLERLE